MDKMMMLPSIKVDNETTVFRSVVPLPGLGIIPVNSFLLRAAQPILVDTNLALLHDEYFKQLESEIDLKDIRWIWITHTHPDHIGNLPALIERAPNATVITNYVGMGLMGIMGLPPERMYLLNHGEKLNVSDRDILAIAPATMDAPETTVVYDEKTKNFFCGDSFGAILNEPADFANDIDLRELRESSIAWSKFDDPWLQFIDVKKIEKRLKTIEDLEPKLILGSHLPPAKNMEKELISILKESLIEDEVPFVPFNQQEMERILHS